MDSKDYFDQLAAPPIFVVGVARSGTTWVLDIFGSHPLVAGAKETWLFTRTSGITSLLDKPHYPATHNGFGQYITREQMVEIVRTFALTLLGHTIKPQHQYLVEKSPSHALTLDVIHEVFPEARFVHIIRDGRDVAVSVRAATQSWAKQWRKNAGKSVAASARSWRYIIRKVRRDVAELNLSNQYMEIRYEELQENPKAGYRRLFDFGEMPYDEDLLETIFQKTDFEKNYRGGERQFRRHGRTGDWNRQFTWWNSVAFNLVAGDLLVELGYAQNRLWLPNPLKWLDLIRFR